MSEWGFRVYVRLEQWLVPGLKNAQITYLDRLTEVVNSRGPWLELGCGRRLVPVWVPEADARQACLAARVSALVGLDVDSGALRANQALRWKVAGDAKRVPFRDQAFRVMTANMVVEHLRDPAAAVCEAHRVLAPGGLLVLHTPNRRSYRVWASRLLPERAKLWLARRLHGRGPQDVFPTFYRLNTPETVRALAAEHGLRVLELQLIESSAETAAWGPLALPELLVIRALAWKPLRRWRANLLVIRNPQKRSGRAKQARADRSADLHVARLVIN